MNVRRGRTLFGIWAGLWRMNQRRWCKSPGGKRTQSPGASSSVLSSSGGNCCSRDKRKRKELWEGGGWCLRMSGVCVTSQVVQFIPIKNTWAFPHQQHPHSVSSSPPLSWVMSVLGIVRKQIGGRVRTSLHHVIGDSKSSLDTNRGKSELGLRAQALGRSSQVEAGRSKDRLSSMQLLYPWLASPPHPHLVVPPLFFSLIPIFPV